MRPLPVLIFIAVLILINSRALIRMIKKRRLIREIGYLVNDMEAGEDDIKNKDLKYFTIEKLEEIIAKLKELPMGKRSLNIALKNLEEKKE